MRVHLHGAQRASTHRSTRLTAVSISLAVVGLGRRGEPGSRAASAMKVVVVVGPVGSSTSNYIYNARKYASQARSYGATVIESTVPTRRGPGSGPRPRAPTC